MVPIKMVHGKLQLNLNFQSTITSAPAILLKRGLKHCVSLVKTFIFICHLTLLSENSFFRLHEDRPPGMINILNLLDKSTDKYVDNSCTKFGVSILYGQKDMQYPFSLLNYPFSTGFEPITQVKSAPNQFWSQIPFEDKYESKFAKFQVYSSTGVVRQAM